MPKPPTVCATPGCHNLTPNSHCTTCQTTRRRNQAQTRRANQDPSMDAYTTPHWRTTRARHLRTHPTCTHCHNNGNVVDHIIPRQILTAAGIHNPDHPRWLQTLCDTCHNRKTRTTDTPLIRRLNAGEDATLLASQALNRTLGGHP